ncbi:MAG: hypothetical protein ACI30O_04030 [Muribaculaceae bacterium]
MKIIIRKRGAELPYEIINNVVSIKENEHCLIVNTKKNRLMYSKPEFEMDVEVRGVDNG